MKFQKEKKHKTISNPNNERSKQESQRKKQHFFKRIDVLTKCSKKKLPPLEVRVVTSKTKTFEWTKSCLSKSKVFNDEVPERKKA